MSVRYALRWGEDPRHGGLPQGLDVLLETPPEEVEVWRDRALAGVWITVTVPDDMEEGSYGGELHIGADGLDGNVAVPVELNVSGWRIPDSGNWRTWIEMIQSPDTLALEYDMPLWSEEHFELIGKSFRLIRDTGSRVVYIPLLRETNQGNEQSMVRWVRREDGSLEPDYTIMERYLDTAQENLGEDLDKVVFYAWDAYLVLTWRNVSYEDRPEVDPDAGAYAQGLQRRSQQRWDMRQGGLAVTIIDEETGDKEAAFLPHYTAPGSRDVWRPVYDELRERMRRRGLEDAMVLGMVSDMAPSEEEVEFLKDVTGDLPWIAHSHYRRTHEQPAPNTVLRGVGSICYEAHVYRSIFQMNPDEARSYGWQIPELRGWLDRVSLLNGPALTTRLKPKVNITGLQRGIGRMGGDFWPVLRDGRGRRTGRAFARYPENQWRGLNISNYLLAPGPEGPVATARLENLREGVQECEARILIESALLDEEQRERLGKDLAERAQTLLDIRQRALWRGIWFNEEHLKILSTLGIHGNTRWPVEGIGQALRHLDMPLPEDRGERSAFIREAENRGRAWFAESGWLDRNARLFELAAEVQQRLQ